MHIFSPPNPTFLCASKTRWVKMKPYENELLSTEYFYRRAGILSIDSAVQGLAGRLHNQPSTGTHQFLHDFLMHQMHGLHIPTIWIKPFLISLLIFFPPPRTHKRVAEHSFPYKMPALPFKIKCRRGWVEHFYHSLKTWRHEWELSNKKRFQRLHFFFLRWCTRNKQSPHASFSFSVIFVL